MPKKLINSQCQIHKKICQYLCNYSKCVKNLICQKCRRQHLSRHPAQFIYQLSNLAQIHSFNKIDKLKQMLIKQKLTQQYAIANIYSPFQSLATSLTTKIKQFNTQSRQMIQKQLTAYLKSNKIIIQQTQKKIFKSPTEVIKDDPNKMLQQTINQAQIINKREDKIMQNGQSYKWYSDTTKQMCENIVKQIGSMISVAIKIIDNSLKLQRNKYISDGLNLQNPHDQSFIKRYPASTTIAYERSALEAEVLKAKNIVNWKDNQISKANKQIKDKVMKIQQLQQKVQGLREELVGWEQKAEIQQRERLKTIEKQKKKKEEVLIKNGIIGSNGKSISLERKNLTKQDLPLILQIVPHPLCLDLSNHLLQDHQLQIFYKCSSIQILKFNFTRLFKSFPNLVQLQLNSAQIDDSILMYLSKKFPYKLKILYLIDNKITDDGLQAMFINMNMEGPDKFHSFDQMYLSYNKLSQRSIQVIHKYSYQIKKLHIAKNHIRSKGGQYIGKYLKDLDELFVGSTGISKEGFLSICRQNISLLLSRNCLRLRRLSIVANQVSTEIITEILLGLHDLKWLDISYCNMTKSDMEKVQKLRIFNKDLEIITSS